MQIDYKTFAECLCEETKRAIEKHVAKTEVLGPGCEDRQGYIDALISAPTLVRYFFCKDRSAFHYEQVLYFFEEKIRRSIGLVQDYRYPWDQHLEFARARGYLYVVRLLRQLAARQCIYGEKVT